MIMNGLWCIVWRGGRGSWTKPLHFGVIQISSLILDQCSRQRVNWHSGAYLSKLSTDFDQTVLEVLDQMITLCWCSGCGFRSKVPEIWSNIRKRGKDSDSGSYFKVGDHVEGRRLENRRGTGGHREGVSSSLLEERSGMRAVLHPQKNLNFSISKWCVLVYSVALNLTFWLQQKRCKNHTKITH